MNLPALYVFRFQVFRLWHRALSRRSQNGRLLWDRMRRIVPDSGATRTRPSRASACTTVIFAIGSGARCEDTSATCVATPEK
jgi:hypothetical protein